MKKQYIKPITNVVETENLMAEICNESFVYTSKGGASLGWAKVCYHYRWAENDKYGSYRIDDYGAAVINIPPGATFIAGCHDGKAWNIANTIEPGWHDFSGTNGTCHFAGDIILADGTWINKDNVNQYRATN